MKFWIRHILIGIVVSAVLLAGLIVLPFLEELAHENYLRGSGDNTLQLMLALDSLDETNPAQDVARRMQTGDNRYIGCWSESGSPEFPGIPQANWQDIVGTNNYWMIEGTTDGIESRFHGSLIDRAWIYARSYNATLNTRLSEKK